MKTNKIFIVSFIAMLTITLYGASGLAKKERDFAMDYLKSTQKELVQIVKPLNETQLRFKSDADSWSIAECLEHIAVSEEFIFGLSQQARANSADAGDLKFDDETLINVLTDRTQKAKTLDPLKPKNAFDSPEEAIKAFNRQRKSHIEYLRKTSDPLREFYFDFPFGKGDAYQVILFMGAHSERHTKQIREIISHPNFPE